MLPDFDILPQHVLILSVPIRVPIHEHVLEHDKVLDHFVSQEDGKYLLELLMIQQRHLCIDHILRL